MDLFLGLTAYLPRCRALSMGHGMDRLVRFVSHHHLVQLYVIVVVLLVQSMGKAKTFSCC
jgi:hypothetical protein